MHVLHMNKHVQIRNLPDAEHRKLKERAAAKGLTITDYVKRLIERELAKPSMEELYERLKTRKSVHLSPNAAEVIRQDRDDQ